MGVGCTRLSAELAPASLSVSSPPPAARRLSPRSPHSAGGWGRLTQSPGQIRQSLQKVASAVQPSVPPPRSSQAGTPHRCDVSSASHHLTQSCHSLWVMTLVSGTSAVMMGRMSSVPWALSEAMTRLPWHGGGAGQGSGPGGLWGKKLTACVPCHLHSGGCSLGPSVANQRGGARGPECTWQGSSPGTALGCAQTATLTHNCQFLPRGGASRLTKMPPTPSLTTPQRAWGGWQFSSVAHRKSEVQAGRRPDH